MNTVNLRQESLADQLATVIHELTRDGLSSHDIALVCLHVCALAQTQGYNLLDEWVNCEGARREERLAEMIGRLKS